MISSDKIRGWKVLRYLLLKPLINHPSIYYLVIWPSIYHTNFSPPKDKANEYTLNKANKHKLTTESWSLVWFSWLSHILTLHNFCISFSALLLSLSLFHLTNSYLMKEGSGYGYKKLTKGSLWWNFSKLCGGDNKIYIYDKMA